MRDMSDPMIQQVLAHNAPDIELVLVTISMPDYPVVRLVRNNEDIISRGNTYKQHRMAVELPDEVQGKEVTGRITIDNVSQLLVEQIRNTFGGVPTKLEMVLASDKDTVVLGPFNLVGRNIAIDRFSISMDLTYEDILNLPFPKDRVTPLTVPGMFSLTATKTASPT